MDDAVDPVDPADPVNPVDPVDEAQFGPFRWTAGHHDDGRTGELRGARFEVRDLRGARFVDCDLTGAKVVSGTLVDVDLTGYVEGLRVNGVDVTAFVQAELDRRYPERVQLRELADADGFRALWRTVQELWDGALARARLLPEAALHEQVDGEWSFVQTLRHLVYITDSWVSRTVLDEPAPFHRWGLPQSAYDPRDAAALGMELDADPSLAEVLGVLATRRQVVERVLADLTDEDLGRLCSRTPAPGYPEEDRPVAECLHVLLMEEMEHVRYAERDLDVLERRPATAP